MPEIGHRDGNNVDRRRRLVGRRRTRLRMVFDRLGELFARRFHIHRSRLPASSMECGETHVVFERFAVEKWRSIVHVKRNSIDHQ